ncbi:MAG: phosphoribosyltransferase domain-containing protein [Muribaculaceae bacterium]|nr:phosphoribosyltransferase domain-containing protein [Muribaculaceae bacterium]
MQVVTLNPQAFENHAERLAKAIEAGSALHYDAIVGVRRGGSIVCDALCRHLPTARYGARYDVTLQRPSTKHKGEKTSHLLKRLPIPLLDAMRMAEAAILLLRRKIKRAAAVPEVEIPQGLASTLTNTSRPEILVIDDAIDSGDTLYAIAETLKKTNPDTRISIAVITETTRNPRIRSNYTLYRNRTLIRFPWSNDYKEN